ncbi:MAG: hypothetical protein IPJ65_21055 [Archangiaceae bacterium]|nr:hypothetical protein [Archangiaceae bacterium]
MSFVALALAGAAAAAPPAWPPALLSQTGLYADARTLAVAPALWRYSPQYPLWSDGASKRRWVSLPSGKTIDAADPDAWVFPVGTRFWKEFSFAGRKVETRFLEKQAKGRWAYATYAWNAAQTDAERVGEGGAREVVELAPGVKHDLPSLADCRACHEGNGRDAVLGFGALQLSGARDPNAPHAEPFEPGMVDLGVLLRERRLGHAPHEWAVKSPVISAAGPEERAALGYLHGNCWGCHNARDPVASLGLRFDVPVAGARPGLREALEQKSRFQTPGLPPGQSTRAQALRFRLGSRHPSQQMPPLATKLVDEPALALLKTWLAAPVP